METPREPIRILVEPEVTRFQEHPEDSLVQVWGYVGDYEISVWLSRDDPRLCRIQRSK